MIDLQPCDEMSEQIWGKIRDNVPFCIRGQISDETYPVLLQTWDQVGDQVCDQIIQELNHE